MLLTYPGHPGRIGRPGGILGRTCVATVAALGLAGLAACGGSSSGGGGTAGSAPPNTPSSAPAAPAGNTLAVQALDYSYDITGSPKAGLVDMTFINKGKYAHEMGVSKIKDGVTLDQVKTALAAPNGEQAATKLLDNPDAEYPVPAITGPNTSVEVHAPLAAGHYAVICFLPGPDGKPHVAMGMIADFTVRSGASDAQPPATNGKVMLTDKSIDVPANLASGGTFAVTNTGTKSHDFSLAKLKAPGTLSDLFQCVGASFGKNTPIDTCPGELVGGVNALAPGQTAYLTTHLPAGNYGYVSTAGNGADFMAGLHGELSVS